jgi:hypothetical protein
MIGGGVFFPTAESVVSLLEFQGFRLQGVRVCGL